MESLYRKYRPLTFESVVGQQHIVSTLEHAVSEGRLSHAYLFCGPRGTGKTTMARILAKALLCEKSDAARAQGASGCMACGTCPECEAIAEGNHPDVYELDAASRTGVDNVREEIINSVSFAPVRGKYKVYIIDEVHMLTSQAFNALLKTLEEPPSHVIFVLCTTDPQKILETILSRCQRFDFRRISNEDIVGRLRYVCERESFEFDQEALEIVARHARGGMRDALSTLEQLSVFGNGSVRASDARALLGEVSSTVLAEFARAIAERDVVALFGLIREQVEGGNDLMELTRDLVAHARDLYAVRVAGARPELFDCTPDEVAALGREAAAFETADRLARILTVLDNAALEMRNASDTRLVLEIACTRLARPESDLTLEALAERLERLERQIASGVVGAPMDATALAGAARGVPDPASKHPGSPAPAPARPAMRERVAAPAPSAGLPWDKGGASAQAAPGARSASEASLPVTQPPAAPRPAAPGAAVAPTPATMPAPAGEAEAPLPRVAQPVATPAAPAARTGAAATAPRESSPAKPVPAPAAGPAPESAGDAGALQRRWDEVFKRVRAKKPSYGSLLLSARAQSDDGSTLLVGFPAGSGFALKMVGRADSQKMISEAVASVFGTRDIKFVMDGEPASKARPPRPDQPADASPVAVPMPKAPSAESVAPRPQQVPATTAPAAPAPAPRPAPSPRSGAAQRGFGEVPPWEAEPAPAHGAAGVDHTSGPTVVGEPDVEAQRRAWENEQVPYDDAFIASYEEDADVPPMDLPPMGVVETPPAGGSVPPANADAKPASAVPTPSVAAAPSPAGAMPWANHPAVEDEIPQNEQEAKEMLGSIFGSGIVFKSDE